jgi:hypothetical protein
MEETGVSSVAAFQSFEAAFLSYEGKSVSFVRTCKSWERFMKLEEELCEEQSSPYDPRSGDTVGTMAYPLDAGFTRSGTIHIDDWLGSRGSVAGRYNVLTKDAGLSGTFCVRAR